jgi:hypothetical protein
MTSKEIQEVRHKHVDLYKMSSGCCLCGYNNHPSALCFDHLPDQIKSDSVKNGYSKRSSAGGMYRLYSKQHSIDELIQEIKKCRILCVRCHMELTHSKNSRASLKPEQKSISISDLEEVLKKYESNSVH